MAAAAAVADSDATKTAETTASATPAAASSSDPNRIVCRSNVPITGTRLGAHRECRTQKEWDDIQRDSQKVMTDSQTRGLINGTH